MIENIVMDRDISLLPFLPLERKGFSMQEKLRPKDEITSEFQSIKKSSRYEQQITDPLIAVDPEEDLIEQIQKEDKEWWKKTKMQSESKVDAGAVRLTSEESSIDY